METIKTLQLFVAIIVVTGMDSNLYSFLFYLLKINHRLFFPKKKILLPQNAMKTCHACAKMRYFIPL